MSSHLPRASAVHESLKKELPNLNSADIVKALVKHGHVADDSKDHLWAAAGRTKISPIAAAADRRNLPLLREVLSHCRRLGYKLDPNSEKPIDLFELDQCFAASGASIDDRFRTKSALKQLHLI